MTEAGTRPAMFDAPLDAWYVWVGLAAVIPVTTPAAVPLTTARPTQTYHASSGASNMGWLVPASVINLRPRCRWRGTRRGR